VAIDREKVLQAAQKYVEKKKYDKAVIEYQRLVAADPNDARTLLKIGDLQTKMGTYPDAISTYEGVGHLYAQQGFALKAIAVYKQIRELIAKHAPTLEERYGHITPKLAELYEQLGLVSDALAALDEVATRLQRQQRDDEAIQVCQKIVQLDPTNPLPHLRLAEALSRTRDIDGAVASFKTAATQLVQIGRRDDAVKVLERLLHHRPDLEQARLCAELYLQRGQPQDGMLALAKLQVCFQADPRDLDTLALLSRAFTTIGQAAKSVEVQKEMARVARDTGRTDLFRDIAMRLLQVAPQDEIVQRLAGQAMPERMQAYQQQAPAPPPPPPQVQQQPAYPPPPAYAQPYGQQAQQQHHVPVAPPAPHMPPPLRQQALPQPANPAFAQTAVAAGQAWPMPAPPQEPEQELEEEQEEQEAEESYEQVEGDDFYEPAGEVEEEQAEELEEEQGHELDHASAQATEVGHVSDPEGETGPTGDDLPQLLTNAAAFKRVRLYDKALGVLEHALSIDPRSVEVYEAMRDIYLEDNRVMEAVQAMLGVASLYVDALDGDSAARMLQDVLAYDPDNERAIELLRELGYEVVDEYSDAQGDATEQGYDEASRLPSYDLEEMGPEDVSSQYADPHQQVVRGRAEADPLPSFSLDGQEEEPAHDGGSTSPPAAPPSANFPTSPPAAPAPARAGGSVAPRGMELEDALEESEFFASRGLFDDAYNILAGQLDRYPNHPLLRERLAELEYQQQSASGARERPTSDHDRSFDIAESLDLYPEAPVTAAGGFNTADQQVDVEEVFQKFKEGVEKQVAADDSQTHYDLAVAYKEMGLIEDAIREFDVAARDQEMECVCQSMIGTLELGRGNVAEAIEAFLRGLNSPVKEPAQETSLLYELGNAYEAKKMNREALAYFQKVVRRDPRYRDVGDRIARLSQKAPPVRAS
jgi:tetratricopeptide (TPR) repeat protein